MKLAFWRKTRIAPETTLDHLRAALVSLQTRPFCYSDWSSCTCGHVYRGATGHALLMNPSVAVKKHPEYAAALAEIIRANALPLPDKKAPHRAVGEATFDAVRHMPMKEAAIRFVSIAILDLEMRDERLLPDANRRPRRYGDEEQSSPRTEVA